MPRPIQNITEIFDLIDKPTPLDIQNEADYQASRRWYQEDNYVIYSYQYWLDHLKNKIRYFSYAAKTKEIRLNLENRTSLHELVASSNAFLEAMQDIKRYITAPATILDNRTTMVDPEQIFADSFALLKTFNKILLVPSASVLANDPEFASSYHNECAAFVSQTQHLSKMLESGPAAKMLGAAQMIGGLLITLATFSLLVASLSVMLNPGLPLVGLSFAQAALGLVVAAPACVYGVGQTVDGYKFFSGWHSRVLTEQSNKMIEPKINDAIVNARQELQNMRRHFRAN